MTPHSLELLNAVDRVVCQVIDGTPIDPAACERLACAKEAIERMLDGRICEGTDHMTAWGEISAIGREHGKTN